MVWGKIPLGTPTLTTRLEHCHSFYRDKDPDPQPVNFNTLLNEVEEPVQSSDPPKTEIYCSGSVLLTKKLNNSNSLADVFLAKLKSPVFSNMKDDDVVECIL